MPKSIQQITKIISDFGDRRGWENNDPNQLISSILIELGELAEHYQWQDSFIQRTDEEKKALGFEFVDIIFYLFRLADKSGVDIEAAFDEKLPKLEAKFPVGQSDEEHDAIKKEYRESGKNKLYD